MSDLLRIGWIGLGEHSLRNLMPYLPESCKITAVCDTDPQRIRRFEAGHAPAAVYHDFCDMAEHEELNAVFCAVSPAVHYKAGAYFARLGIPVFMEKTPCETMEQAEDLLCAQREGGALIQTGFNRRFATGYVMARKILATEGFGRPTLFSSKFHASPYRDPDFLLTNHLIHHLDLARFLIGELSDLHLWKTMVDEHRVGYHFHAVSEEGTLVSIETSGLQDIRYPMERVEITGVGTMVCVENMRSLIYHRPAADKSLFSIAELQEGHDALSWQPNLGFPFPNDDLGNMNQIHHFIRCVQGKEEAVYTFEDTVRTMRLMDSVLKLAHGMDG